MNFAKQDFNGSFNVLYISSMNLTPQIIDNTAGTYTCSAYTKMLKSDAENIEVQDANTKFDRSFYSDGVGKVR